MSDTTPGGTYYEGSSCEKGYEELCISKEDCPPERDGVKLKDCIWIRLGSSDVLGNTTSPYLGMCAYGR